MKIFKCLLVLFLFVSGISGETICNMKKDAGGYTYIYSDENGKELATARMDTPKIVKGAEADPALAMNMFSTPNFGMFPKLISGSIPDGEVKVYNEGKVTMVENFQNGQRNGKSLVYNPGGNVIVEFNYAADLLDGKMVTYNPDGTQLMEMTFDKGIMAEITGKLPGQDKTFSMSAEDIKNMSKELPKMRKKMKESGPFKGKKIAFVSGETENMESKALRIGLESIGAEIIVYSESADEDKKIPSFADADLSGYEMVIFDRDSGKLQENNANIVKIKKLAEKKLTLVALGESVMLLAKAGVLYGKKVAAYSNDELTSALKEAGAVQEDKKAVRSGKIVTCTNSDLNSMKDLFTAILKSDREE